MLTSVKVIWLDFSGMVNQNMFLLYKILLLFYLLNLLFSLKHALYVLGAILKIHMFPICLKCWPKVKGLLEKTQLKNKFLCLSIEFDNF